MSAFDNYIKASPHSIVTIQYGKETITFNLVDEAIITEEKFQRELKRQASKYGFCLLIWGKLKTEWERLKSQRRKVRGKLYAKAKKTIASGTGRVMSDEAAKAWVESRQKFLDITEQCIKAKDQADTMYAVVKAFEQRKDLLQTISSNKRNEN